MILSPRFGRDEIMYEQLIDDIVEEILRRITNEKTHSFPKKKKLLELMSGTNQLSNRIHQEYFVTRVDLNNIKSVEELNQTIVDADCIVISHLEVSDFIDIAIGNGWSPFTRLIQYALLHGKDIFILEDGLSYREYKSTANKNFYRKLLDYEACIKGYGIRIISEDTLLLSDKAKLNSEAVVTKLNSDAVVKNKVYNVVSNDTQEVTVTLNKRLILENDLIDLNIKTNTAIRIGKNSIVTPSALDYARTHRIRFIKE